VEKASAHDTIVERTNNSSVVGSNSIIRRSQEEEGGAAIGCDWHCDVNEGGDKASCKNNTQRSLSHHVSMTSSGDEILIEIKFCVSLTSKDINLDVCECLVCITLLPPLGQTADKIDNIHLPFEINRNHVKAKFSTKDNTLIISLARNLDPAILAP
jgi:hypothetical protein